MFDTIIQRSKGYLVRLGITRRVFQKVAYVWYFWRTSAILFVEYDCTICRAYVEWGTTVRLHYRQQRTSALKDKRVHPPTLAYVRSKSPIPQNALLADPSDPKSKLTL
jgi:hypothetical protein